MRPIEARTTVSNILEVEYLRRILPKRFGRPKPVAVFILSSDHSGSTWLGYVLGSSSESAFVGELWRAWDDDARVPCTVCASRGLSNCVLLHNIEKADPRGVFALIAKRSGKRVLIENSKRVDWTKKFLNRSDSDIHLVHVIKDPRGRWASMRRRLGKHPDLNDVMSGWCRENEEIRDFAEQFGLPTTMICYDIVAADQQVEVPRLFASIDLKYEPSALRYWEIDHHGYAANGASSAMIEHKKFSSPPDHFATADDAFYKTMFGQAFADVRWRTELPSDEIEAIEANDDVSALLYSLGFRLTKDGVSMVARPKAAGQGYPHYY